MPLELKQDLKLEQHLILTPQLQQAIKLLQMSQLELKEHLENELQLNPILEETAEVTGDEKEDNNEMEMSYGDGINEVGEQVKTTEENDITQDTIGNEIGGSFTEEDQGLHSEDPPKSHEEFDEVFWQGLLDNTYSAGKGDFSIPDDDRPSWENFASRKPSLYDHLIWQLRLSPFSKEEESIGELIIGNLDENGYLQATVQEIATMGEKDIPVVEGVLRHIQEFDPPGVAARDLRECLLNQAAQLNLKGTIVEDIIKNKIRLLEKKEYQAIARDLGVKRKVVIDAVNIILSMEPKPGRAFSSEDVHYIIPDIYIVKFGNDYVILLNNEGMPHLKINRHYRNILLGKETASSYTRDYLKEKYRSALWMIKSIQQRQKTIYKVASSISKFQKDFLDRGILCLKPLTLRDVAEDIDMHESTISRVTTNKYAHTQQGIFELKFFFSSGIDQIDGGTISSETIKLLIKKLIEGENAKNPMSDLELANILNEQSINVARRTVAKYREVMGILPSNKRKIYIY